MLSFLFTKIARSQDWPNLNKYKQENIALLSSDESKDRVVFMGNSITEFWKRVNPEFFKGKPYVNRGISAQTTPQMLLRFKQDVIELKPKVVVILAGTNDIAGNTGPSTLEMIFDNISSMSELADYHNIKVIISSVLPASKYDWKPNRRPADKIIELNKMLKQYANANNFIYLDYYNAMVDDKNGLPKIYSEDGVHPNLTGYNVMEPMVEKAIYNALHSNK